MKTTIQVLILSVVMTFGIKFAMADAVVSGLDHVLQINGEISNLKVDQGATVLITQSNGDVVLINGNDPIPANLAGAIIDVFDGCITAIAINKISLCIDNRKGFAKALAGTTNMTTDIGENITLAEGYEYDIIFDPVLGLSPIAELAPPTAAGGDDVGNSIIGFDPFDSTNDRRDSPGSPS